MKTALTDRAIKAVRPAAKAYDMHDAVVPGLTLNVLPSGLKRFVLLRRFPGGKHPTRRALGQYGELTLEAARSKARQWLEWIAGGIDPAEQAERERRDQDRRRQTTFAGVVEDYIRIEVYGPGGEERPRHRTVKGTLNALRDVLVPMFGHRPIAELTTEEIMAPIELIGRMGSDRALVKLKARKTLRRPGRKSRPTPEQARALFAFAEMVFNWAIDHGGYGLEVSPLARVRKSRRLGSPQRRDRTLNDEELIALMTAIARLPTPHRQVYEVLLHSGLRLNEAAGAQWNEIEGDIWTVPPARMKGKNEGENQAREHVVPITLALRKIFAAVPRGAKGDSIFSFDNGATPIVTGGWHIKAMLDDEMVFVLRQRAKARGEQNADKIVLRPWRNHDIRRSCRSTLSRLGVSEPVAEAVIAHVRPGVKGTYDRWTYLPEKREALEKWSRFLADLVRPRPVKAGTARSERATMG
jgi:integrase